VTILFQLIFDSDITYYQGWGITQHKHSGKPTNSVANPHLFHPHIYNNPVNDNHQTETRPICQM